MLKFYTTHLRVCLIDTLQKHFMPTLSIAFLFFSLICPDKQLSAKLLMKSHRYYPYRWTTRRIRSKLPYIHVNAEYLFDGEDSASEDIQKTRGLVLKDPILDTSGECIEKGVFLITFTGTLQYYIRKVNVTQLQQRYWIVIEPSWAGYCLSEILWWSQLTDPVFIQSTEKRDYDFLLEVSPNLIPLSFGASDWVNPDAFFPIPNTPKLYDFIYVTNYSPMKRNHIFLKALQKIRNHPFKAALISSGWGGTRDYNQALAKRFGLCDKLDIIEGLNQQQLNTLLNKAKVNVLLSLKEGSNRSLFEGFAANTPGILLKGNIGVNKEYITPQTGVLIDESRLSETLLWFKEHWQDFSPNEWVTKNISVYKTKEKLDSVLSSFCKKNGHRWTVGTKLKMNGPEATLYRTND